MSRSFKFLRVHTHSANFEDHGVSAPEDWRYDAVSDYLLQSHSYLAVKDKAEGKQQRYPLPADYAQVFSVYQDFGDFRAYRESRWWESEGMHLFGLKAPLPKVTVEGTLDTGNKSISSKWAGLDSILLKVPTSLTAQQALKQIKAQLSKQTLASEVTGSVAPKYKLLRNRLRQDTVTLGAHALNRYRRKSNIPLWKIGHELELVPSMVFELEDEALNPENYSVEKATLATAARRLVKQAILIAENAARGRFFTDKNFTEAMTHTYQRKAGRPVGTSRKK